MEMPMPPGLTLLVVDDETSVANALATFLGRDGDTVETAATGKAALRKIHAQQYDLILCDLRLPELDGQDFYHLLKTEAPDLHRRVIFLTGDMLNPASLEFLEQHHLVWLPKPCSAAQVREAMQHALRQGA
jgi:CheY-like chemotaxis protein